MPDAGGAADLRGVQDPALDRQHLAGRVPGRLGRVPDAATVTTYQRRRRFDAFGGCRQITTGSASTTSVIRSTCSCTWPASRAEGGIDVAGDGLDDVASGERRPFDAQLAHDAATTCSGVRGAPRRCGTDGRLDDVGGSQPASRASAAHRSYRLSSGTGSRGFARRVSSTARR